MSSDTHQKVTASHLKRDAYLYVRDHKRAWFRLEALLTVWRDHLITPNLLPVTRLISSPALPSSW